MVTPKVTVPVGFRFHQPDPKWSAWKREDRRLKRAGVKKPARPEAPAPDPDYPGKAGQVLELIGEFRRHHPEITVKAVLADALFGTQPFLDEAARRCGQAQAISQLRANQKVRSRGRERSLADYFQALPGFPCACASGVARRSRRWSAAPACTPARTARRASWSP